MPAATLETMLAEVAARAPGAVAVVERDGDRTRTLSYGELVRAGARVAAGLAARGVRRGDVVAVWMPNRLEALAVELALSRIGAAGLAVNVRFGSQEVGQLVALGRPVGVIGPRELPGADLAGRLRDAMAVARDRAPDLVAPWFAAAEDLERPEASAPPRTGQPGDPLKYFTTSGSTGLPKLAGHDQASVVTHARNVAGAVGMRSGDVLLGALPLSGVFGFNPAMSILAAGGTLLLPVFDAAAAVADMAAFGVTHAFGGDDLFGRLMGAWEADPVALPAFRRGGIADFSGRSGQVARWAEQELGATVTGLYGSSELFALTAIWPVDQPAAERLRGGGRPVTDTITVRVADARTGAPCAPEEVGELQFRGYPVLQGYLGDPAATRAAFTDDGWLRSGDLGSLTADGAGFVYVCRAGDALRLRGYLVEPAEIERHLLAHPLVRAAKVVGVRPDGGGAERAVAYVTCVDGAGAAPGDLLRHCREALAPFKVPTAIEVLDELPVTTGPNGTKVRVAELRARARDRLREGVDR